MSKKLPIIDIHAHAFAIAPGVGFPAPHGLQIPKTYEEYRDKSIQYFREYNMKAVPSGSKTQDWYKKAPDIIIPGCILLQNPKDATPKQLRQQHEEGNLKVLGELALQYTGIPPNDPKYEPYYELAIELDLPVIIHIGPITGGVYKGFPYHRAKYASPLLLEDVLVKYPEMRISVAHAGYPRIDEMLTLLYGHPQLFCDISGLNCFFPKSEFYYYLGRLVGAGFSKRVMYGSDQMYWPEAIPLSVKWTEQAPFLTEKQKRDIFYNNAKRFLRL